MTSPVDGVVLERPVVNEQFLPAGERLLVVGRLEELEVEAEILSQDVVRIEAGDEVEIYGPAVGRELGHGVPGSVQRIFPGGFTKISSLGVEQQRVKVIIDFAPGALHELLQQELGVDFRVRVRVFTRAKTDALRVPRTAIFRGADGGWQVFAVREGRAALTPVEVGLMNDGLVEITAGLDEGQQVLLAPESRNSGNVTDRMGAITKQGSSMVRSLLGQVRCGGQQKSVFQRFGRARKSLPPAQALGMVWGDVSRHHALTPLPSGRSRPWTPPNSCRPLTSFSLSGRETLAQHTRLG